MKCQRRRRVDAPQMFQPIRCGRLIKPNTLIQVNDDVGQLLGGISRQTVILRLPVGLRGTLRCMLGLVFSHSYTYASRNNTPLLFMRALAFGDSAVAATFLTQVSDWSRRVMAPSGRAEADAHARRHRPDPAARLQVAKLVAILRAFGQQEWASF